MLRLAQAGGKYIQPVAKNFGQPIPEPFVLVGQFLPQIADKATLGKILMGQVLYAVLQIVANALERRNALVVKKAVQLLGVPFGKEVDNLNAKILLGAKVVIKRPLWHASSLENRFNAGGVKP